MGHRRSIAGAMMFTLIVSAALSQDGPPIIRNVNGEVVLELTPEMGSALQRFNRDFQPWKSADYSSRPVETSRRRPSAPQASFALIVDANKDGLPDVILDGHDNRHCLLVCLLSHGKEYIAEMLNSSPLVNPGKVVSYDDDKKVVGLNYLLFPRRVWTSEDNFDPKHTFVFQIVYPQQSDSAGNPINEGGSVSFYYEDGKFIRGDFDPL